MCRCSLVDLCAQLAAQHWQELRVRMRPSLGGKFAMFGVRHGPGHGHLSRLQDLLETLVANHGEQVEVWMQPPVLLPDEELVGDEPHDAADMVIRPRAQPRMAALLKLYVCMCL